MAHINTHSPIPSAKIDNLISDLKKVKTSKIDGGVLANMVRICHECGLKKNELIELSVMDVSKGGKVNDSMEVGDQRIALSDQAKGIIQEHIDYLKSKGYPLRPQSPLFPTKKKKRYTEKTLDNHLKDAQNAKDQD